MLTIVDAGNNARAVKLLNPQQIISLPPAFPVDGQPGPDPSDVSRQQLPSGVQANLVTAFGILEQIPEWEAALRHLRSLGCLSSARFAPALATKIMTERGCPPLRDRCRRGRLLDRLALSE